MGVKKAGICERLRRWWQGDIPACIDCKWYTHSMNVEHVCTAFPVSWNNVTGWRETPKYKLCFIVRIDECGHTAKYFEQKEE